MCFKYIKYTINEKVFAKHRKIKEDINKAEKIWGFLVEKTKFFPQKTIFFQF
jgi:hypothetical protein